jgi:hypothetical protein
LELSGGSGAHQGDSRHRHGKVWVAGVVAGPEGEFVARPANDNRFVPTADQAFLGKDDVAGLDGIPITAGEIGSDWLARVLTGFTVRIDGGDDLFVQVFPDWRDHRWASRMNLASREFGDEISRYSVGNHNHVEAQLFGGGSGLIGLGMGKPGRVRPPITVEAEHDDFPYYGGIRAILD